MAASQPIEYTHCSYGVFEKKHYMECTTNGSTILHGFACAILSWWFLLSMALAGPPKEKPHLAPVINAGTAEPLGVSPPEVVADQVLVTP
jgi:hypothetical protein